MPTAQTMREIRRAGRPHGVMTGDALRLTPRQIGRCCDSGVLERRHHGVFVDPALPRTPQQDLAVAVAAGGHLAAGWGRSAGGVWTLTEFPQTPEIVIPHQRFAMVKGAVVHRSRDLCWGHVMVRDGILVTTAPVTALDLGVVLGARELAEVLVRARQLKLFEPSVLRAMVARLGRPGRTGIRTVRAALDLVMIGDRPADSVLELRFAFLAHDHGLPPYEYQHSIRINGKRFDIDFAFPTVRLAIEVDGYERRRSSASLDYDDHRGNLLVLDGWTLLRFTWSQVCNEPAAVAGQILAALGKLGYQFGR